jgi:hypothetical protein
VRANSLDITGTIPVFGVEFTSEGLGQHGGVVATTMGELRDQLARSWRLGCHVLSRIEDVLEQRGLAHWPPELPASQDQRVLVFDPATDAGALLRIGLRLAAGSGRP